MKKLLVVAVVVALALPALAWSASPYLTSVKDGKYEGTISSVVPAINGQKTTLEVKHEGEKVVATVTFPDGKEVWTWTDKVLEQKELDPKTGSVVKQYTATATKEPTGTEQNFAVNCKDKAKNVCDGEADFRSNWTIKANPDGLNYVYFGVPKDKRTDTTAKAEKRIDIAFKAAK